MREAKPITIAISVLGLNVCYGENPGHYATESYYQAADIAFLNVSDIVWNVYVLTLNCDSS